MIKLRNKFSTKILIANSILFITLLSSILFYFYHFLSKKEDVEFYQTLNTLNIKVAEQVDSLIYNMDKVALQVASNPYILDCFSHLPSTNSTNIFETNHFLRDDLRYFLTSYMFHENNVTRICLYDESNNFLDSGYKPTNTHSIADFFSTSDFDHIQSYFDQDSTKRLFIPPRKDPFSPPPKFEDDLYFFSIVRPIKNYTTSQSPIFGYVEVQLNYRNLDNLFDSIGSSINAFIVDDMGNILYPLSHQQSTFFKSIFPKDKYLLSSQPLVECDYTVILAQDKHFLLSSYRNLQYLIIIIFLIAFTITAIIQLFVIRYFTKPLVQLQKSIEVINVDNLSLNLLSNNDSSDEFIQLNKTFTRMFNHLNTSIQHTLISRTSELKSHLFALQAQMDPHFMHNILTVMGIIAEENNVPKLENMCYKLSSMLRFSSSYKDTNCTLLEEFNYTQSYLELMQDRYENLFSFTLDKPSDTQHIFVPKLIIQPLAENCFNHGFKQKPNPWHISITSLVTSTHWTVTLTDNGIGFSPEFMNDFSSKISTINIDESGQLLPELEIGGLCLINIYLRLKILYKDALIFSLENIPSGGAQVTIGGTL